MNNSENAKLTLERFLTNRDAQRQVFQFPPNSSSPAESSDKQPFQPSSAFSQPSSTAETSSSTLAYQHPNTAQSVVRLSDNEISEILSLPIALVSDNPYSAASNTTPSNSRISSGTPSNVDTTTTMSAESSIISQNNQNSHFSNVVGFDNKLKESPLASVHMERNRSSVVGVDDMFINNNNNNNNTSKTTTRCDNSLDFLNPLPNAISMNKVCSISV